MNITKAKQRQNIAVLMAAIEKQPFIQFNLDTYRQEMFPADDEGNEDDKSCGTIYCSAGLAASLDHFKMQGFKFENENSFQPRLFTPEEPEGMGVHDSLETLFGRFPADDGTVSAFRALFDTYGQGYWDEELQDDSPVHLGHKELALARLAKAFEIRLTEES